MHKKYNEEKMSDEEIERELKRVQLQREKIQLENDISRMQRASNISDAISKSGIYIKYLSRNFFKVFIFIAFFLLLSMGLVYLKIVEREMFKKNLLIMQLRLVGKLKILMHACLKKKYHSQSALRDKKIEFSVN